jgi:threonine aldolase
MYADTARATASTPPNALVDLRSDTVTRPDAAMRQAMAKANVGDDVYGDDPTVNALEQEVADRLGKERALFLPTGTQSNLAACLSHCARGEEIIIPEGYHILASEAAGASVLGGIALKAVAAESDGSVAPETIMSAIRPDDPHVPVSRLLVLENTHRGQAILLPRMQAAAAAARDAGLSVHLDGARLFNAAAALSTPIRDLAASADTISLCLSKGLGAPAGTVLAGDTATLTRARRWRKMLGGGMRQSGILAAAARHALAHNVDRLADDHTRAATLTAHLTDLAAGDPATPPRAATNMVFFTPRANERERLMAYTTESGILLGGQRPTMRIVLHKDIDDAALDRVMSAFTAFYRAC